METAGILGEFSASERGHGGLRGGDAQLQILGRFPDLQSAGENGVRAVHFVSGQLVDLRVADRVVDYGAVAL